MPRTTANVAKNNFFVAKRPSDERERPAPQNKIGTLPEDVRDMLDYVPKNNNPKRDRGAIPGTTANLIMTPTTATNLRRVAALVSVGKPVLLEGPTSAGKTATVNYLGKYTSSPVRRFNMSFETTPYELIGHYVDGEKRYTQAQLHGLDDAELESVAATYAVQPGPRSQRIADILTQQTKPRWVDGPVVHAARHGEYLLLDELNLARPEMLDRLNSLFDGDGSLMLTERGGAEKITPKPGFQLFGTMNPSSYAGRGQLSEPQKTRWVAIYCKGWTKVDWSQFVRERYPDIPRHLADQLIEFHAATSQKSELLGRGVGGVTYSLRNIERVCERFMRLRGRTIGDHALMARESQEVYIEGLVGDDDRTLVKDLHQLAFGRIKENLYPNLRLTETPTTVTFGDVVLDKNLQDHPFIPHPDRRVVLTRSAAKHIYMGLKALLCGENLLYVGPPGTGKTAYMETIASYLHQPFFRQAISGATDTAQLVGGYDDTGWHDSLLLQAGRAENVPGLLLLDEMNLANSALLERLNPLLERDRKLLLPEREGENIALHPRFYVTAAVNPPTLRNGGRKKLSPALGNRFQQIYVPDITDVSELTQIAQGRGALRGVPGTMCDQLTTLHTQVVDGHKVGRLGQDLRTSEKPTLSTRQLLTAVDSAGAFIGQKRPDHAAFRLAAELVYGSTASDDDNEKVMAHVDHMAQTQGGSKEHEMRERLRRLGRAS